MPLRRSRRPRQWREGSRGPRAGLGRAPYEHRRDPLDGRVGCVGEGAAHARRCSWRSTAVGWPRSRANSTATRWCVDSAPPIAVRLSAGAHVLELERGGSSLAPGDGGAAVLNSVLLTPAGQGSPTLRMVPAGDGTHSVAPAISGRSCRGARWPTRLPRRHRPSAATLKLHRAVDVGFAGPMSAAVAPDEDQILLGECLELLPGLPEDFFSLDLPRPAVQHGARAGAADAAGGRGSRGRPHGLRRAELPHRAARPLQLPRPVRRLPRLPRARACRRPAGC